MQTSQRPVLYSSGVVLLVPFAFAAAGKKMREDVVLFILKKRWFIIFILRWSKERKRIDWVHNLTAQQHTALLS